MAGFLLLLEEESNWGLVRLEMRPKMTRIGMMTEKYREQIPFHDKELPAVGTAPGKRPALEELRSVPLKVFPELRQPPVQTFVAEARAFKGSSLPGSFKGFFFF